MAAGWSARRRRAAVQAAAVVHLAVPLLLVGCVPPPPPAPGGPAALQGSASSPAAAPFSTVPAPEPQEPPPPGTGQAPPAPTVRAEGQTGGSPPPASPELLPAPQPATATPAPPATANPQTPAPRHTATAYYVLVDDGGSQGVRFGCNDSLVGVDRPADGAVEPLAAAIGALLADGNDADLPGSGTSPDDPADVYNALANSRLKFLSGTFDGSTVTVYLAGALSLGGTCDIPRVEAQLTQTAVAAVGAIRAEIYVNGQSLTETLRMD